MNTPKRHHYIPQFILKNFADDFERIWYVDKRKYEKKAALTHIRESFFVGNLHTLYSQDGQKNVSLEHYFRDLENAAAPVLTNLIKKVRARELPQLSLDEKLIVDYFFFYQRQRSPDVVDPALHSPEFHADLANFVSNFEASKRDLTASERALLQSEVGLKRIRQNARVHAIGYRGDKLLRLLDEMGLGILAIRKKNKSFLIGSHSVHKVTNRYGTKLGRPGVQA